MGVRCRVTNMGRLGFVAAASDRGFERLVTMQEAQRRLGVGRTTIYGLMAEGRLPYVTVSRSRFLEVEALRAYVEQRDAERRHRLRHGTQYAYEDRGCRCVVCRAWWNERHRRARARQAANLAEVTDQLPHGTIGTYRNWRCRCAACSEAQLASNRGRPRRAKSQ